VIPFPRALRDWRQFNVTGDGLWRVVLWTCFIVMMGGFGIQSFLRARKISRS
jgi:hypothetical protein